VLLASRDTLRSFLSWAESRRLITGIQLPKHQTRQPLHFADDAHRWNLARTLLHDDSAATISDCFAGLLVLLYAQPVARIARPHYRPPPPRRRHHLARHRH
jgi:hypothetical protein